MGYEPSRAIISLKDIFVRFKYALCKFHDNFFRKYLTCSYVYKFSSILQGFVLMMFSSIAFLCKSVRMLNFNYKIFNYFMQFLFLVVRSSLRENKKLNLQRIRNQYSSLNRLYNLKIIWICYLQMNSFKEFYLICGSTI